MSFKELIEQVERLQGRNKYGGPERRKHARLIYPPKKRPMLKVGIVEIEIVDISEQGMRLFNYKQHKFDENIRGTVKFLSGGHLEVQGKIVWQFRNELGLFTTRIPRHLIEEETYALLPGKENR
ncbi:MAG: PilZ domain-containing protein [Pseudomonadota bacterium]